MPRSPSLASLETSCLTPLSCLIHQAWCRPCPKGWYEPGVTGDVCMEQSIKGFVRPKSSRWDYIYIYIASCSTSLEIVVVIIIIIIIIIIHIWSMHEELLLPALVCSHRSPESFDCKPPTPFQTTNFWVMLSTHLINTSQNENRPNYGVKMF